jgi:hypothetical protein
MGEVMMKGCKTAAGMRELGTRIEEWRKSKPRERRMPEELWRLAADLAEVHGAGRVSKQLGIGFVGLKSRMGNKDREIKRGTEFSGDGFVELVNLAGCGPIRVEVSKPDGCQLRLELSRGLGEEGALLLQTFLG